MSAPDIDNKYKHLGKNFVPPDVLAKVTGQAKYAEDFRAEGMAFCRFMPSPYPHARVKSIDASEALKMEGVYGILTADEVPKQPPPGAQILTNEPLFVGDPVLAVAAVDETTVQNAFEKIKIEWEPLPFIVNPLKSLRPDGVDARTDGNIGANGVKFGTHRWKQEDFDSVHDGKMLPRSGRSGMGLGRPRRHVREVQAGNRRDVRHREQLPPQHGASHDDGLVAEREVLRLRLDAEPVVRRAATRQLHRHQAG